MPASWIQNSIPLRELDDEIENQVTSIRNKLKFKIEQMNPDKEVKVVYN